MLVCNESYWQMAWIDTTILIHWLKIIDILKNSSLNCDHLKGVASRIGICLQDSIVVGHIKININEYTVYLGNSKIDLTYKEFEILRTLVQNKGTVFSRKDLLEKIWGIEYIGGTRTVDVHIRRLRGKLGDEFNSIIETVRNVGYKCKE